MTSFQLFNRKKSQR